jgi:hypothetical protein
VLKAGPVPWPQLQQLLAAQWSRRNPDSLETNFGSSGYPLRHSTREIPMSNPNQNPGQQNQNPGQKPGQQQQGGGQKPGQQQQDPNRQGQNPPKDR